MRKNEMLSAIRQAYAKVEDYLDQPWPGDFEECQVEVQELLEEISAILEPIVEAHDSDRESAQT